MTMGRTGTVLFVGPILLLLLGAYRIFSVAKDKNLLNCPVLSGVPRVMRVLGILAMVLGAIAALAWPFIKPIALAIFGKPGDSGVAFYVVGVYLAIAKGFAPLGVVLFEASRLMGFESEERVSVPNNSLQARRP
jgi:hypothetical protein